ncbi:RNA polymerase sigma factor [Flavitalea flava]
MKDYSDYSEHELLLLLADGDRLAFRQLFDCHWGLVYGVGLRLTKSPELSKDLVQDIFLKLWDNRIKLSGINNFKGYLYKMASNLAHDQLRSAVFRESNKDFLANYFSYNESSPHEMLEKKELGEVVNAAINSLPPKLLQVFSLNRFEGLSHDEIARRLDISPLSSKTYMVRALMSLRTQLSKNADKLMIITILLFSVIRFNLF